MGMIGFKIFAHEISSDHTKYYNLYLFVLIQLLGLVIDRSAPFGICGATDRQLSFPLLRTAITYMSISWFGSTVQSHFPSF
jgi:hypothetical protein